MKPRRPRFREEFNLEADLVANRDIPLSTGLVRKGAKFPKHMVTLRRLRELYDAKRIGPRGEPPQLRYLPVSPRRGPIEGHFRGRLPDGSVQVTRDWKKMPWPALKGLAESFAKVSVRNKIEAEDAILAELARREPA